eukprot:CAMPEP_0181471036 /NCGR_PEP_ID=MMETSP1110-20121109/38866_1 /TAXON_ID=174948 /ORGANISM="Symbiodinium sp., Strain CCMP421" /LENGTH=56 /DNA_ID=CAMNT_0023596039 /DNA_START=93 /DNA_END=263 /DNA_ORIENTATION=-
MSWHDGCLSWSSMSSSGMLLSLPFLLHFQQCPGLAKVFVVHVESGITPGCLNDGLA